MVDFSPETIADQEAQMASVFELPAEVAAAGQGAPTEPAAQPGAGVDAPSSAPVPAAQTLDGPLEAPSPQVGAEPAPAAPVVQPAPAAPAPAPTPAAPAAPAPGQVVLTQEQFDQLMARSAAPAAAPAAPTPAAQEPAKPETVVPVSYDELVLPEQLTSAIFSEDAAQAASAMNVLVRGLASTIHTRVKAEYETTLKTTLQQRDERRQQETAQQTEAQTAKAMQDEFYGEFPALNNPLAKTIVVEAARELSAEQPNAAWDQNYRAAMAARAQAKIAALAGIAAPAAPATPASAPTPAARPAAFVAAGTRQQQGGQTAESIEDQIADIMGGGGFDN